ncbi:general stress protein [Funiculus sociatus GB2-A5]|uniref:General stress protein n=1 Tax=Funiculus sociatus GB2-A5 TaxID=2933946 RepID=A0ABV0JL65_9CYAN|nr:MULTISPECIES: general stress protein [unclassified Trichocoleus]MBD1905773.1 histidine kinase [Trichocoleus sp. FACHB-832]MBD2065914.1 histidine kinase [Trichocoleus sp. FACHB-6]
MTDDQRKRAVGVFSSPQSAEYALNELKTSGFSMSQISIVARDRNGRDEIAGVDVRDNAGNQTGSGATAGALAGGAVGGFVGLLGALSALTIPGIGPVVAGGALASILGDALIGGAVGAATGGIVGALMGLGIPEEQAQVYNHRLSQGDYLVIVEGTQAEITKAESILGNQGIQHWGIYDVSGMVPSYPVAYSTSFAPLGASNPAYTVGLGLDPLALNPLSAGYTVPYAGDPNVIDMDAIPHKRAVGIFSRRRDVEDALHELKNSGFLMDKVSVVAKDADRHDEIAGVEVSDRIKDSNADEGATTGAIAGGALGGLTGLLIGLGALAIPGVGPILFAGAEATAIATTIAGGGIGAAAGGLTGALIGLGIPEQEAKVYHDQLSSGDYLVLVNGTEEEIQRAESILKAKGIHEWGVYNLPENKTSGISSPKSPEMVAEPQDHSSQGSDRVTIIDNRT